jgi:hydroxylamine dehydrogenase
MLGDIMTTKIPRSLIKFLYFLFFSCLATAAFANTPDFEQLKKSYYDTHPGKGSHGEYWEPIPIQKYWNPKDFYKPPKTIQGALSKDTCIACHESTTPGAFHAWKKASIATWPPSATSLIPMSVPTKKPN